MKPRSAKAKGQSFSKEVRQTILNGFPELHEDDIKVVPAGVPGMDLWLSPHAQTKFPFAVENKRQENASIWEWLKQAQSNSTDKLKPLLVFRRNRSETYACLRFDDFMEIIKQNETYNPNQALEG